MPNNSWTSDMDSTITKTKKILAHLSIEVRTKQYQLFQDLFKPNHLTKILDVGVCSDETLPDTNFFEKKYPFPNKLTAATIENPRKIQHFYPEINVIRITSGKKLPFRNKAYDVAVSWATLEHVGSYQDQEFFLQELYRVGKHVFVTTPYRGCIYEPHTGFFFIHWLPLRFFRFICKITGKKIWSSETMLHPLWKSDLSKIDKHSHFKVIIFKMFNFLPSHMILWN